jgi:biopolymer transport protein ExbB/TolQ
MADDVGFDEPELSWSTQDFEQKIGFTGGRYTETNAFFTFLVGLIMTTIFFLLLEFVIGDETSPRMGDADSFMVQFSTKFIDRGIGGYVMAAGIMLLFFWSSIILFVKGRKVKFQRSTLALNLVPQDPNFFLNTATAREALLRIRGSVDDTSHFLLLNRIEVALSNLQNIGQISDVSSIVNAQASIDEDQVSSSYNLLNGFLWAIPVLGFIGTVLGLGQAIGEFGNTIQLADDMSQLKESLKDVTGGLSTAFDTTLLGLVGSIAVQMIMTFRKRQEFQLLDECNEYCQSFVLSKLRLEKGGGARDRGGR